MKKIICLLLALLTCISSSFAIAQENWSEAVDCDYSGGIKTSKNGSENRYIIPANEDFEVMYYEVKETSIPMHVEDSHFSECIATLLKGEIVERTDGRSFVNDKVTWIPVKVLSTGEEGYIRRKSTDIIELDASSIGNITLTGQKLFPKFDPRIYEYTVYDANVNEIEIQSYVINKNSDVDIITDENSIQVISTLDDNQKVYTINVIEKYTKMPKLKKVKFSGITINDEGTVVPFSKMETTLTYTTDNPHNILTVTNNGEEVHPSRIPLYIGENEIIMSISSPTDYVYEERITITRSNPSKEDEIKLSSFEKKIIEAGLSVLPERHPFVLAYESTYKKDIKSYTSNKNGVSVSGIPYQWGGNATHKGFSDKWWNPTKSYNYPAIGTDCAKMLHWIYRNAGYVVRNSSAAIFLQGKEGVSRKLPGVKEHKVIPSIEKAKIGDVSYMSSNYKYISGSGSHIAMFIGTARKLGIADELRKYYPDFPVDAYLVLEQGYSDNQYYQPILKEMGIEKRTTLCGVGIQFHSSLIENGEYLYKSPYYSFKDSYTWTDSKTGYTFEITSEFDVVNRLMQYKSDSEISPKPNISRPVSDKK